MILKWKLSRTTALGLFLTLSILFSCKNNSFKDHQSLLTNNLRLDEILERGKLIALTDIGSTSYYLFRGEPMGYQYELLRSFADYLGVKLEIHIESDPDVALEKLNAGAYDVVAKGLNITRERKEKADFTAPMLQSRKVLVQRKPANWRKLPAMSDIENKLIRSPLGLDGKTVHVQHNSGNYYRLVHLQQETGSTIRIVELPATNAENLIQMVANGEIDYTVCDEYVAGIAGKMYPDIDVQTHVSIPQNIGWAVSKGSQRLLTELNKWWQEFNQTAHAQWLFDKYFNNPKGLHAGQRDFYSRKSDRISYYDDVIRKYSQTINWDWRLLASLIYQESKFQPEVVSHKGAFGIMQMMPATAEAYGVDSASTVYEHIAAGVRFIKWLDNQLLKEIFDPVERQKFVLAAYNAGIAHVYDARRLAVKNNKNPNIWDGNVDYFLLNKSKPEYYRDSVVQYGYCRGDESYRFVNEIMDRFSHYKNVIRN